MFFVMIKVLLLLCFVSRGDFGFVCLLKIRKHSSFFVVVFLKNIFY